MRPRILVSSFLRKGHKLGKHFDLLSTFDYGMVSQNYVNGVLKGGGLPIVSPQIREDYNDNDLMEELINQNVYLIYDPFLKKKRLKF